MRKIAVVGLGCAGYHGVKALRENGFNGEIHVFSDAAHPAANPMLTTYYVTGTIPRERLFPFGNLEEFQKEFGVILHMETRVAHVGTKEKKILLEDGSSMEFDGILISTGARAVSPKLGQGNSDKCFLMRTAADADRLKAMIDRGEIKSAAIVGASMVGIKVVELLNIRGVKVSLIDMADHLFPVACMKETAEILEEDLRDRGVELLLSNGVDHVEESSAGIKTYLKSGICLETDILVLCIGTRANVELAANTEVLDDEPVKINKGIVVNNKMETNIPGIFAAGDCCEGLNLQTGKTMIIGLWANAAEQGRIAGIRLAGGSAEYSGSVPNNITHYFDKNFIGIGNPNMDGRRYMFKNNQGIVSAIMEEERLNCVNILGNYRISGIVKDYFMKNIVHGEKMTSEDMGFLRNSGVPVGFIELLGGNNDGRK